MGKRKQHPALLEIAGKAEGASHAEQDSFALVVGQRAFGHLEAKPNPLLWPFSME